MTEEETLVDLIERAYGSDEVQRYSTYRPSSEHLQMAKLAGEEVLRRSPIIPGACTYLSAMWAALLRDNMRVPAFCVAGDLSVRGRMAFGSSNPDVAKNLTTSDTGWDGHCWLALGAYVGDLSIFRSAYAAPEGSNLRATVYQPKHVATEEEINCLIQGARAFGRL